VAYLYCFIGAHIKPEGWANWNNTNNYLTTRYEEYRNYGPSANPVTRIAWAKQLTDEAAGTYTLKNILGDWNPQKQIR
jgi:pectinesterase